MDVFSWSRISFLPPHTEFKIKRKMKLFSCNTVVRDDAHKRSYECIGYGRLYHGRFYLIKSTDNYYFLLNEYLQSNVEAQSLFQAVVFEKK